MIELVLNYLGCDPGIFGGFALISGSRISLMFVMPTIKIGGKKTKLDIHGIASFLKLLPCDTHVVIEEQPPVRNQNIVSTCTTQRNYGGILCALTLCHRNYTVVTSSEWQLHFGITSNRDGKEGKTTKQQAAEIVQSLFPNIDFRASHRAKKPHEGLVDAALIGLYLAEKERDEK